MPGSPTNPGFFESLRRLAGLLVGAVHDRVQLLSLDVEEERQRLLRVFIWASAALFAAACTMLSFSALVVILFWETARMAAITGVTLFYAAVATTLVVSLRRYLARLPKPFAATLAELSTDRDSLRDKP